jgi:signal transduction histidine kinase
MPETRKVRRSRPADARYEKLRILYRISNLINSTTRPPVLLRRILAEAVREMKASSGSLAMIDEEKGELELKVALGDNAVSLRRVRLNVGQGIVGRVAETGKPLRVDDVRQSPHYIELRPEVRSELAVPLRIEGRVAGVLNVDSDRLHAFSREDERLLVAISNQAAKVIQTSLLYDRLERQTDQLEALFAVGQALISPDPLPDLLNRITRTVQHLLDIKLCSVMLLSDRKELVLSAVSGGTQHYAQRPALSVGNSLIGEVVTRREPVQVFDVRKAPRYRSRDMARKERLASLLSVPIAYNENLIGILNIYTAKPRHFSAEDIRLLNAFASLCGVAIENARSYERVLKAEESIRQTDRLATLGILSAEIAHEIRNPVTIISMLTHSLAEDGAVDPSRARDVEIIAEKLERINRIVSQVLNFSKQRTPRLEWVNLNHVLEDLLFLVNHTIAARQVAVRRTLDPELPEVLGDRGHFDQVFLNLILNALEAMPSGGALSVRTSRSEGDGPGSVTVNIRDTGPGIPPEVMEHLFLPFVTSRQEGVGLGLFVSQKLLAQYGGTIGVKSTGEKGTQFNVEIPIEARAK